jgi:hypothetical protein
MDTPASTRRRASSKFKQLVAAASPDAVALRGSAL